MASKRGKGLIHLTSSNKGGAVLHGAMVMTTELKILKGTGFTKLQRDLEQTAVSHVQK